MYMYIHFVVQQKLTQHCKATKLQLKKRKSYSPHSSISQSTHLSFAVFKWSPFLQFCPFPKSIIPLQAKEIFLKHKSGQAPLLSKIIQPPWPWYGSCLLLVSRISPTLQLHWPACNSLNLRFLIFHLSALSTQLPLLESPFMVGPPGKHQSYLRQFCNLCSVRCFLVTLASDPSSSNIWVTSVISIWWDWCLFHLSFPVPTRVLAQDRQFGVNGPTCTSRQGDVSRDVCSQRIWNYIKLRECSQCAGKCLIKGADGASRSKWGHHLGRFYKHSNGLPWGLRW